MKTDQFSSTSFRITAVLLAGFLLLAASLSAGGTKITYRFGKDHRVKKVEVGEIAAAGVLAQALAKQVKQVDERFTTNRKALKILSGPGNVPGYLPSEVTGLIVDTHKDLNQAIQNVQPSGTEPLRAWVDDQFQQIQGNVPPPGPTASLPVPSAPRAIAVFASLRGSGLSMPMLAVAKPPKPKPTPPKPKAVPPKAPQPPKPQTIPVTTADRLLDQVEEVVRRIFVLADHNDLEVKLWVGSTASRTAFSFWSQGQIQGATLAPLTIRTDGKKDHILRGLYNYRAAWSKGSVTQVIQYPTPAGAPVAQMPSERLDLVNGTGFFCCRFDEQSCRHVANEKECRR